MTREQTFSRGPGFTERSDVRNGCWQPTRVLEFARHPGEKGFSCSFGSQAYGGSAARGGLKNVNTAGRMAVVLAGWLASRGGEVVGGTRQKA